jgi:hypothetical protein
MSLNETIEQQRAMIIANAIMTTRMWGYLSGLAAMAENINPDAWIDRQRKMSLESADRWEVQNYPNPDALRDAVKQALNIMWGSIIRGAFPGDKIQ